MVSYNFKNLFSKVLKNKNTLNILSLITYLYLFFLLINNQLEKLFRFVILLLLGFSFVKNYIFIISFIIIIYNIIFFHNNIENFNAHENAIKELENDKDYNKKHMNCCNKNKINPNENGKFIEQIKKKSKKTKQILNDFKNNNVLEPPKDNSREINKVLTLSLSK
jgi:hypothetical protein